MKSELSKGVRKDSLLFDLKFGDKMQDFFTRCLELNQKGLITQGPSNKYAQYILKENKTTQYTSDIILLFYATANEKSIINGMDMKFYYSAWAPWNKDLTAVNLIPRVKDTLLAWFPGNDFLEINFNKQDKVSVKVDGNRIIKVYGDRNEKDVNVIIENLNDEKK